jgi:hypothetical protein
VPVFGGLINARLGDGPRNPTTFADALHPVFLAAVAVAVVALAFAVLVPERELREHISEHLDAEGILAEPVL